MKTLTYALGIFALYCACSSSPKQRDNTTKIILLRPDTTGNIRAVSEFSVHERYKKVAKQLNLSEMETGADSIEIRLWVEHSLTPYDDLLILKGLDTLWTCAYYKFNLKYIDSNFEIPDKNLYQHPVLHNAFSKFAHINFENSRRYIDSLQIDSIWSIPSQCELTIPKELGQTDSDNYYLEIADKKRYKFINYSSPDYFFKELKDSAHSKFIDCTAKLISLIKRHIQINF